jgi:CubicO group peptidase (beta-lactamase class C family)
LSFEDYLQQRLFKPAGMKNTGFINKRLWNESLMSVGYKPAAVGSGAMSRTEGAKFSLWDDKGASGVSTTSGDMRAATSRSAVSAGIADTICLVRT